MGALLKATEEYLSHRIHILTDFYVRSPTFSTVACFGGFGGCCSAGTMQP